jgi:hypothetical protein
MCVWRKDQTAVAQERLRRKKRGKTGRDKTGKTGRRERDKTRLDFFLKLLLVLFF